MLARRLLLAMALACPALAQAFPGAGPGSQLDMAARDLNAAVQNLTYVLNYVAPGSGTYQDSVTLGYATQHFMEEVELGPEDLNVDFDSIEQTFTQLHGKFMGCHEVGAYQQVREALFRVEEANVRLRQAFLSCGHGGGIPQGPGIPVGYPGGGYPGGGFPRPGFPGGGFPGGGFPGGGWHHGPMGPGFPHGPFGFPGAPGMGGWHH